VTKVVTKVVMSRKWTCLDTDQKEKCWKWYVSGTGLWLYVKTEIYHTLSSAQYAFSKSKIIQRVELGTGGLYL
jgi:hypothetical protein